MGIYSLAQIKKRGNAMVNINYDQFNHFTPVALNDELWRHLLSLGHEKKIARHTQLLVQGQPAANLICLTKGNVKTVHIFPNGNEKLYEVLEAPAVIGHEALFAGQTKTSNLNVIALTDL